MHNNHTDPSQNFIGRTHLSLDAFFKPKNVAVIGAKDDAGSVGRTMMLNLLIGVFGGAVYPVNPRRKQVLGVKTFPSISEIPEPVDLAVIVTPAQTVPGVIEECVSANVKSAIVISAGFKELGAQGLLLEEEILKKAKGHLRIIGPNCLGVMNPHYGLNATFAKGMALPGNLAFISQSGAMCTAVLDWSYTEGIGFSSFVSIGSMADVDWGDLIGYLGDDEQTESILMYMETVGDPRSFLSAAREVALQKPIIVIKAGRSQQAAIAAASHTGALVGSDEVFNAALERAGVLRVNSIAELFSMASALSRQPKPKGDRLAIVTNAGGPSVLATDACTLNGAQLAEISPAVKEQLNAVLPAAWSHSNPVDILGDALPDRFQSTIEILSKDPSIDGILTVLSPQDVTEPTATAECLKRFAHIKDKVMLASWMGGRTVAQGVKILNKANIPVFEYPDDAAKTFAMMWTYGKNLLKLYETPQVRTEDLAKESSTKADEIIDKALQENRTLLTEEESKRLLSLYGIPTVETIIAVTAEEAVAAAREIGYPIVLKLYSHTITHKTDVGGVKLNLETEEMVADAFNAIEKSVTKACGRDHFNGVTVQPMIKLDGYELILGSSIDNQFGPVVLFGSGGQLVEVYKDQALTLPPLTSVLALHLMEKTRIFEALEGVRGRKGIDIKQLEGILVNFSYLLAEHPRIKECDINPLLVTPERLIALDARVILHEKTIDDNHLPKLAIRPYPTKYISQVHLRDGTPLTLHPIKPEDVPLVEGFLKELSDHSVRQHFLEFLALEEHIAKSRVKRLCFNDYDREWSVAALLAQPQPKIVGIGRLSLQRGTRLANLYLVISDAYLKKGLGTAIMTKLIEIAKEEKINAILAEVLSENDGMIGLCKKFGFKEVQSSQKHIISLLLTLSEV